MAGRVCDVPACSGQVLYSARMDGSEVCQKCGVVYNPRPYPVRRDPHYTAADLLGPERYPSLQQ